MTKEQIIKILKKYLTPAHLSVHGAVFFRCSSITCEELAEEIKQLDRWVNVSKRYPQHKQEGMSKLTYIKIKWFVFGIFTLATVEFIEYLFSIY